MLKIFESRIKNAQNRLKKLENNTAPTIPKYDLTVPTAAIIFQQLELSGRLQPGLGTDTQTLDIFSTSPFNFVWTPAASNVAADFLSFSVGPMYGVPINDNTWHNIDIQFNFLGSAPGTGGASGVTAWKWEQIVDVDGSNAVDFIFQVYDLADHVYSTMDLFRLTLFTGYIDDLVIQSLSHNFDDSTLGPFTPYASNTSPVSFLGENVVAPTDPSGAVSFGVPFASDTTVHANFDIFGPS